MIDSDDFDRLDEMRRLAAITRVMDTASADALWDEPPLDDEEIGLMAGPFVRRPSPPALPRKSAKREVSRHG